jgi:hypothetical protein
MERNPARFESGPRFGTAYWLLVAFVPASVASDLFVGSQVGEAFRQTFLVVAAVKYLILAVVAAIAWLAVLVRRRIGSKYGA